MFGTTLMNPSPVLFGAIARAISLLSAVKVISVLLAGSLSCPLISLIKVAAEPSSFNR